MMCFYCRLDIIKTRLQTSNFARSAHPPSPSASTSSPHSHPSPPPTPTSAASPSRYLAPSSSAPPRPPPAPLSIRAVAREIYADGLAERARCPSTGVSRAGRWGERVGGLRAFSRGLGSTLGSSFVGSAVTITVFEVVVKAMGAGGGGGGLG